MNSQGLPPSAQSSGFQQHSDPSYIIASDVHEDIFSNNGHYG
jgi:hypothetical protein